MTIIIGGVKYTPGMYAGKRPTGAQLAENYFKELDKRLVVEEKLRRRPEIFPTICFSRKIGVGALEIADILAAKIGDHVVDQEVLEYIAKKANLSEKAVAHFSAGFTAHWSTLLNGQIRKASGGIQVESRLKRPRGTGIHASGTGIALALNGFSLRERQSGSD